MSFLDARSKFLSDESDENRKAMVNNRNKYRKMCRMKKRQYDQGNAAELLRLAKQNPREFWKKFKSKNKTNNLNKCNFFSHFQKLASMESLAGTEAKLEADKTFKEFSNVKVDSLDKQIDMAELNFAINDMKKQKACGEDMVFNEAIINSSFAIKYLILTIFNNLLSLEYFPNIWSEGSIVPVFKAGDINDSNNYRGLTLISCFCKLMTKIMNKRISEWAEKESKLHEAQYGFRKGRGTTDCIFILHGIIESALSKGKQLYAAFIDYEKAYDYLDRGLIWAKLLKEGLSSKCIRFFRNMYSKMIVGVRGDSRRFKSSLGVLQGEITSSVFFSFFINDLEDKLPEEYTGVDMFDVLIKIIMYADDQVVFSQTKEGLQKGLNNLFDYCKKWGLKVNAKKTKVVIFRKGGRTDKNTKFMYDNNELEIVSYFKYLGLIFSQTGSFAKGIQEIVSSARRALFGLKRMLSRNNEITIKLQIELFDLMIAPILFYGAEIWGFCKAEPIERFHLSFLKSLLGVKNSTANCFVYGELGVMPLHIERKFRIVKFWVRILNSNENSYLYKVYLDLLYLEIYSPEKITWVSLLKDLLFRYGFGYFWMLQKIDNPNSFLRTFKERISDIYKQEWQISVNETSSNRLYKHIKERFHFEPYLNLVNKAKRLHISKVRLSSHLFLIERGRWGTKKLKLEERKCEICNVLEDEYHCLIECVRFERERRGLLPPVLVNRPSMFEFVKFLKNKESFSRLGQLCRNILTEYRNQCI